MSDEKLKGALPRLARASTEDVLAAVGRGEMFSGDVVRAVYPDFKDERRAPIQDGSGGAPDAHDGESKAVRTGSGAHGIPVRGLASNVAVRFAPEGGAVPGDPHCRHSDARRGRDDLPDPVTSLAAFDNEPDRWIDVRWDLDAHHAQRFPAGSRCSRSKPGSLAQIAQVIADHDGNIDNVSMKRRTHGTDVTIDLAVWDTDTSTPSSPNCVRNGS